MCSSKYEKVAMNFVKIIVKAEREIRPQRKMKKKIKTTNLYSWLTDKNRLLRR